MVKAKMGTGPMRKRTFARAEALASGATPEERPR